MTTFFLLATLAVLLWILMPLSGCRPKDEPGLGAPTGRIVLISALLGTSALDLQDARANQALPPDSVMTLAFDTPLDTATARVALALVDSAGPAFASSMSFSPDLTTAILTTTRTLEQGLGGFIRVEGTLRGAGGEVFPGVMVPFRTRVTPPVLDSARVTGRRFPTGRRLTDVPRANPVFELYFSKPLRAASVTRDRVTITGPGNARLPIEVSLDNTRRVVTVRPQADLQSLRRYVLRVEAGALADDKNARFAGVEREFWSALDTADKFPRIPDEELMTLVQRQTFRYFYDYAEPVSGMARERNTGDDIVTTGGSGFGLMALIVGAERGFEPRGDIIARFDKVTRFLARADRFEGVWPHWLHGTTGRVRPFSANDDGGDLVETSFMAQALITVRQYMRRSDPAEAAVAARIDSLLDGINWNFYRRGGQNVLYWHWSPRVGWAMNFPLRGWNETQITYVMAATSRTNPIPREVYEQGHNTGGRFLNGRSYYGIRLPLGPDQGMGGPLFFSHYGFLGLNPTNLRDAHAHYMEQNRAHTLINYRYCVDNPRDYVLYGPRFWGLTASDNHLGYSAHDPGNDLGVITPTAALSAMPYAPEEAKAAMRFFYYKLGDRLWGPYGFKDAINPTADWVAGSYLAIDQGPIVIMIENYRTGLLWNLFMSAPEVQTGLTRLGFTY